MRGGPRVAFFAHGPLGYRIVRAALGYDRSSVVGIVGLRGDPHAAELPSEAGNLPYVEFDREDLGTTNNKIRTLQANIIILAWWPHMLTPDSLGLGQTVTLNLHPSLLPYGRGKDPNFWAIVEESPFGVTIHHVEATVDGGDIAFQREIPYGWDDTGKTLYEKASSAVLDLFRESYPRILSFDIPRLPQPRPGGSFHKRRELADRSLIALDRTYTAREILNLIRARTFEPHPACRFVDGNTIYEVRVMIRKVDSWTQ
jgi:methionyl-tRNA formyltransferase